MAVFRVAKTRDYTVMSNHHLKDRALSLKAKGLLSMILSLPDDWNYTTRGLAAICKEGVDSIGATLRELEQAGYLLRNRLRDGKGRITDTEYVIYETPQKKPDTKTPDTRHPDTENPDVDAPDEGKPGTEKPAQLNTNASKTYESKTHESNPYPSKNAAPDGWDEMEVKEAAREFDATRRDVQFQIDYDEIVEPQNRERLDEIVELMTETLCSRKKVIRISGEDYPAEIVKERLRKLNAYHIAYVFASMEKRRTQVKNMRQYLLTTLFRAPTTMDNYYDAEVRYEGIL